jgi:predicted transcriptional regulator
MSLSRINLSVPLGHEKWPGNSREIDDIFGIWLRKRRRIMNKKPTPEEITRKKEYVRFLNNQIYKLTSQQKFLTKQLDKLEAQLKDYHKEKVKTEK